MRAAIILLCLLVPSATAQGVGGDQRPCDFKGHRLMGRVRVVDSFPDFQVKVEDDKRKAELLVRRVGSEPEICGEWQIVDGFADFTVRIVDHGEDFRVYWLSDKDKISPGIPEDAVQR